MDRFPMKIILIGTITLGMTLAMGWGGFDMIVNGGVKTQTRLIDGTDTWKLWVDIDVPVYLKFWLFNITNPAEFSKGAKAVVDEVGPFVYFEDLTKYDTSMDVANDSIKFKQRRTYEFKRDLSIGAEDMLITSLNIPYFMMANILHEITELKDVVGAVDDLLSKGGERILRTQSVGEWLFDGFPAETFVEAFNDTLIQSLGDIKTPDCISDGKYGLYKGRNNSHDGEWEVQSGRNKSTDFGRIKSWNDEDLLPYWKNDTCNALNGTDGMIYQPFIKNDTDLYVFAPELCRSFRLVISESLRINGVWIYRFKLAPDTFSSSQSAENWCFCQQDECQLTGVLHLSTCMEGAPLILSKPHFLEAETVITSSVLGLDPDPEKHDTWVDIHPLSGLFVRGAKRVQMGIDVQPWGDMASFKGLVRSSVPIYWSEEYAEIPTSNLIWCWIIQTAGDIWANLKFVLVTIGSFYMVIGIALACLRRESSKTNDKMILIR